MGRIMKVHYQLSDLKGLAPLTEVEINHILRASDEIIATGGRAMLSKILKGSKDKKIIEYKLDHCPSYGFYRHLSLEDITKRVDWMISKGYLAIDYAGRLPVIIFSDLGWSAYKPIYVDELFDAILSVTDENRLTLVERLKQTNRQVIEMLLLQIGGSKNIGFIRFLMLWEETEVKKVRYLISCTIANLKSV